ncbi:MAG: putative glycoside hydrolase [bacterium]|nr:putative glycoside hydrolase [bacterium]
MKNRENPPVFTRKYFYTSISIFSFAAVALYGAPIFLQTVYEPSVQKNESAAVQGAAPQEIKKLEATHLKTPTPTRAVYMTSCVAGTPNLRKRLVTLIEETELNSVVIDIKDYSGNIAFPTDNLLFKGAVGITCRVNDMREFIALLHEKGIYVIGRITVFQDPFFAKKRPDLAVQKESDKTIWKDYKGISFIDAGAEEYWDYIVALSHESYAIGFDELNFDYVRFPSDGNMRDIYYPWSEERIIADPNFGKAYVLKEFFMYLHGALKDPRVRKGQLVLSADLFGMTTTNTDDLNIGQVIEFAEPYFDYIAPMVYPSHYPKGFNGYQNVNAYPYEIVNFSMSRASTRLLAASSTPLKLRPWLQDFDYPVAYTPEMVRTQIQAVYDAGLDSWMLWNPTNIYTRSALEPLLDIVPIQ